MSSLPPPRQPPGRAIRAPDDPTGDALRRLRRWVLVAGVWAVAATATALIALLDSSDREARKETERAEGRLAAAARKLETRIDDLEARLDDLPRSDDISKLEQRLARAENGATEASADATGAERKVTALEDRVQEIEDGAGNGAAADAGREP